MVIFRGGCKKAKAIHPLTGNQALPLFSQGSEALQELLVQLAPIHRRPHLQVGIRVEYADIVPVRDTVLGAVVQDHRIIKGKQGLKGAEQKFYIPFAVPDETVHVMIIQKSDHHKTRGNFLEMQGDPAPDLRISKRIKPLGYRIPEDAL